MAVAGTDDVRRLVKAITYQSPIRLRNLGIRKFGFSPEDNPTRFRFPRQSQAW